MRQALVRTSPPTKGWPKHVEQELKIVPAYDLSGLTDLDLARMQRQVRESGEDREFLDAILQELGKRQEGRT